MRRLRLAAAAYLILLITSHVVQIRAPGGAPPPDLRYIDVQVVDRGRRSPKTIRMAYRDTAPDSAVVPVVLGHGSPGSSEVLRKLADVLEPRFRVIVPDLPGFGASSRAARLFFPCACGVLFALCGPCENASHTSDCFRDFPTRWSKRETSMTPTSARCAAYWSDIAGPC